jgi:hypothetical protein
MKRSRQGVVAQEVHAEAAHHFHCEHEDISDRHGGLFRGSLPGPRFASSRPPREADPTQFVKPFVKSSKNDFLDAEAIAEAVDQQNMRFVPIKTDDQLDPQACDPSAVRPGRC